MPTILVADDNSNIQKMVTLAVKEMGVSVVGVGNGEAAVRKLSELHPDLILADIFMPVRSGYDVCEFVKHEASLAHIPVVLLAGAFDPFDEREAQRVGADGVLKKPFVPPDPLLAMIAALLVRGQVPVASDTTAPAIQSPPTAPLPPVTSALQTPTPPPAAREESVTQEEFAEELAAPVPALSDEVAEKFGLRRDFSIPVKAEDEETDSNAAIPADFHSWRNEGGVDTSYAASAEVEESSERFWERGAPGLARQEESTTLREAELIEEHAPVAATTAPPTAIVAATPPAEGTKTAAPFRSARGSQEIAAADAPEFVTALVDKLDPVAKEEPVGQPALSRAVSGSPASSPVQEPAATPYVEAVSDLVPLVAASLAPVTAEDLGPSAVSDVAADNGSSRGVATAEARIASESSLRDSVRKLGINTPPNPALVNAIVAAVIEKLRPQILDIVTREILRPVIEALVQREFEKLHKS